MNPQCEVAGAIRFGPFEFDPAVGELRKHGIKIKLQGQPIEILAMLLERPGQVVSREEIQKKLWAADTNVEFEHSVNVAVKRLRDAMNDSPDAPRYIETLPKRGYRFIGAVQADEQAAQSRLGERRSLRKSALLGWAFAVAVIFVGYFGWKTYRIVPAHSRIVVLPFVNLSADPEQEFFSDAITDEMISAIGSLQPERLSVIARTTAMQYKATKKTAREIGRELGVEYILESSVQRAGDRVRISSQLIRAADQIQLWSQSYDRSLGDILFVRRDVAAAVADEIRLHLAATQRASLDATHHVNPKVYELYLKGRDLNNRLGGGGGRNWFQALDYYRQAIAIDPNFAPAHVMIARSYMALAFNQFFSQREAYENAQAALRKALELDDKQCTIYATRGIARFRFGWEWSGPEEDFRRALELNPNCDFVLFQYALYLVMTGRGTEAIAMQNRLIESDPLNEVSRVQLGFMYEYARQYDQGIAYLRAYQERLKSLPSDRTKASVPAHYFLGWLYGGKGLWAEAIQECAAIQAPELCAYMHGRAGHRQEALKILREMESQRTEATLVDGIAIGYAALGDSDRAMAWLEEAFKQRSITLSQIKADYVYDALRADPRFQDLLRRMNFPADNPASASLQ